ncbi:MAG: S8 family serine peptidase [Bacteriovoracaceae bacterium]|nr:S8 family serine peptidase [Bacteriovoracaceae bacterium]
MRSLFLLLCFNYTFAFASYEPLEREVLDILTEEYDYSGPGVYKSRYSSSSEEDYEQALKNFIKALETVKHKKSLKDFGLIGFTDEAFIRVHDSFKKTLFVPDSLNFQSMMEGLSSDLDQEPEYQNFVSQRDQNIFGELEPYAKLGRRLSCGIGDDQRLWNKSSRFWKKSNIKKMIEKETGRKVKAVVSDKLENERTQTEEQVLRFEFSDAKPKYLFLTALFYKDGTPEYSYAVSNNPSAKRYQIFNAKHNKSCRFLGAKTFNYEGDKLMDQSWYDGQGALLQKVYANKEALSLEEIYGSCRTDKPFEEIISTVTNLDRSVLAILDSGVDFNHPDLAYKIHNRTVDQLEHDSRQSLIKRLREQKSELQNKLSNLSILDQWKHGDEYKSHIEDINQRLKEVSLGWDFEENDGLPYDYDAYEAEFDHGTHVAGIAVKDTDDISILPIRKPRSDTNRYYDSIEYAYQEGAKVVNISQGSKDKSPWKSLSKAMENYPDMLFVVAAGNYGENLANEPVYPAAFSHPNMLVVTSVNENNELSSYGNYSPTMVDIAAPGEDIYSTTPEGGYRESSGTSMATPSVSRVAAKIKFINPKLTSQEVIDIILESATTVDALKTKVRGGRVLNEQAAIELAKRMK